MLRPESDIDETDHDGHIRVLADRPSHGPPGTTKIEKVRCSGTCETTANESRFHVDMDCRRLTTDQKRLACPEDSSDSGTELLCWIVEVRTLHHPLILSKYSDQRR
jgi:hypothetical protein